MLVDSKMLVDINLFKSREIKAIDIFRIEEISKAEAYNFIRKYHYLGDAKFFSTKAFGLFYLPTYELVGCATYSLPQGKDTCMGWFSLDAHTKNIFELSRLCVLPELNGTNATSFLLGGSIKELKKQNNAIKSECRRLNKQFTDDMWICRAITTLALSDRHIGSIYQVCNFKYFGLTDKKSDFYRDDGTKNPRGKVSQWHGVWVDRPRKHRYAYILDNTLKCNYVECTPPKKEDILPTVNCCNGTKEVFDNRFGEWYTCPICTGGIKRVIKDESGNTIRVETPNTSYSNKNVEIDIEKASERASIYVDLW